MVFSRFRKFRGQVFILYDKNPLLMNSLVGGIVYVGGEMVIQAKNMKIKSEKDYFEILSDSMNWNRIAQVGALGTIQNGAVMLGWYHFLNITIGSSTETKTVLIKCLLDQLCFATQGDFLFLFICAFNDHQNFHAALNETKKTFLTTWIMDCAIWPLVNFLGFACIPYKLQPSYMSSVLFFWQLYMSSVATHSTNKIVISTPIKENIIDIKNNLEEKSESEESKLKYLFDKIDKKKSGLITFSDLSAYFSLHKIPYNTDKVVQKLLTLIPTTPASKTISNVLPVASQDLKIRSIDLKYIITFDSKRQADEFWSAIYNNDSNKMTPVTVPTTTTTMTTTTTISSDNKNIDLLSSTDKKESILNYFTNISNDLVAIILLKFDGKIDEERAVAIKNVIFGISTLTAISLVRKVIFKL